MTTIGTCKLGTIPRIVAVVDEMIPPQELQERIAQADLLEMRIDCFRRPIETVTAYCAAVRSLLPHPLIGTIRENDYTSADRPTLFRAILPFVDAIDIELGSPIGSKVVAAAQGTTIIVSEHDFDRTPDTAALRSMVERGKKEGADIVKIATMAHQRQDVVRLMEFTRTAAAPVVTIAMGPVGTVSRVVAPLFGSLFSYGYLTRPVAPGQLSVAELAEAFHRFYPV
jgi:3-dehydroquinate dehydratase I